MSRPKKVLIMAGGTGGHIFPALAIARELESNSINVEWLGSIKGMEGPIVKKNGFKLHNVSAVGLRGKKIKSLIKAPFLLSLAVLQTLKIFVIAKPDIVLGMGGFVSGIGGLISKLTGKTLIIHEQNAVPGTTNRILSKIANKTFQAFDNTFDSNINAVTCGNPIAFKAQEPASKQSIRNLLVLGGSLGAKSINYCIPELKTSLNIWHQTGKQHIELVKNLYTQSNITESQVKIEPFIENMAEAYSWADIVICRSGAMTVSEIIATNSVAILIPFPYAIDDHQTANAKILSDKGAGVLLKESKLSPQSLNEIIENIQFKDIKSKVAMIKNINSAKTICDYMLIPNFSNSS